MAINRIRADIDLDAILYNMESMHNKLKPGTMMAAVVKADGYGHGAEAVSVGTANFVNPKTTEQIVDGIAEYMDRYGVKDISELVGAVDR